MQGVTDSRINKRISRTWKADCRSAILNWPHGASHSNHARGYNRAYKIKLSTSTVAWAIEQINNDVAQKSGGTFAQIKTILKQAKF